MIFISYEAILEFKRQIYKLLFKGPRGAPGPRGEAGFDGGSTDGAPGPKGNQGRQGTLLQWKEEKMLQNNFPARASNQR